MVRLDADERAAKVSVPPELLSPSEVRHYLENLPEWWAAVAPDDRKALAETLFAKIRVLGLRKAAYRADARSGRARTPASLRTC